MRRLLGFVALLLAACAHQTAPPFVTRLDTVPVAENTPASHPEQWLLAFIDVETTGLVPGYHEMIDAGIVITDLQGTPVDQLFIRIQPEHPERLAEGARRVNAFDAERWKQLGALSGREAVDQIARFRGRAAGTRNVLLIAFNSQFDTAFLDHLFRSADRSWRELFHYIVLDIPSMAWASGYRELRGADLATRLGIPDEPRVAEEHTGLTGAMLNVRIYRALLANR